MQTTTDMISNSFEVDDRLALTVQIHLVLRASLS